VSLYADKFAYVALLGNGVAVYDVANPARPSLLGVYFLPAQSIGVGALFDEPPLELLRYKNLLLVSNSEKGFAVLNLEPDNAKPCFEGNLRPKGASGIFRSLAWDGGIMVFANGVSGHPAYLRKDAKIYVCKMPDIEKEMSAGKNQR
jgi:hypothetical protein